MRQMLHYITVALIAGLLLCLLPTSSLTVEDESEGVNLRVRDADVQDVIRLLMESTGEQIVIDGDVQGKVTLNITDEPVERVLELICRVNRLSWWKDRDIYVVSSQPPPKVMPTQPAVSAAPAPEITPAPEVPAPQPTIRDGMELIEVHHMAAVDVARMFGGASMNTTVRGRKREPGPQADRNARRTGGNRALDESRYALSPVSVGGAYGQLHQVGIPGFPGGGRGAGAGGVPGMPGVAGRAGGAGVGGGVLPLPEGMTTAPLAIEWLNALLVRGTADSIAELRKIIALLDREVIQVEIQAQFIEMRTEDVDALGIDWGWTNGTFTVDATEMTPPGNLTIGFLKGDLQALLRTIKTRFKAKIINAPKIATQNNFPAYIDFSSMYPYWEVDVETGPLGQRYTYRVLNFIDSVTSLEVTPRVNQRSRTITCYIIPTVSDVVGFVTDADGNQIPQISDRNLETLLTVKDGETIVMGGFIRTNKSTSKNKLPFLSDLPLIGKWLFTSTTVNVSDSELLIFLTPRILPSAAAT